MNAWTPQEWITEAIDQYATGRRTMKRWSDFRADHGDEITTALAIYQAGAACTQRAIAAASIATAKSAAMIEPRMP
jgi:hypothetical protein